MQLSIRPTIDRGRRYAFPAVWVAVFAMGMSLREPLPVVDVASYLSFAAATGGGVGATSPEQAAFLTIDAQPAALTFVRHEVSVPHDWPHNTNREPSLGHGRFAAPGNAVRRQVRLRLVSPRTADELATFFRDVSYTLTDVRLGEAVPPIKVDRVPDDLGTKDGNERKALFITAILPVVLEANQRVLADREQLLFLRSKIAEAPTRVSLIERIWLEALADRYDTAIDNLDELVRRVDIVPPSMAIAQGGVESGWGTSFAARNGNSLFGQIQSVGRHSVAVSWKPGAGMPQPFTDVSEATVAYVANLNTHPAYVGFRTERAAMREQGEQPQGYRLIGTLLRYSERGQGYVKFVRQIMRENELADFDKARLASF